MQKKLIALVIILALLGGAAAWKLIGRKTDGLAATGTIEITRVDIASKVAGYLTELVLETGETVKTGQVVARIDRLDLTAQVLRDEAALDKAKAQLKDLESGSRSQELSEAEANLASAQSVYTKAAVDWERYQSLYQTGAVAAQQLDAAKSTYDVAANALTAAQSRLSLAQAGYRPEAIEAQRKEVARSAAVVDASKVLAKDTTIASPIDGLVLSKNYEQGEYVNPGAPIATIGNTDDCWVKVYIPSTQLGQIMVGQPAKVRVDSFPERDFPGMVKEISETAEFNPRQSLTERERSNMVFAVKVKVDNAERLLKPGMPADVIFK